jgi:hypothetical protein
MEYLSLFAKLASRNDIVSLVGFIVGVCVRWWIHPFEVRKTGSVDARHDQS